MTYTIKLPKTSHEQPEKLPFEGINPKTGEKLGINRQYFTKNDRPWYPIMGEFHFSRFNENYWEEEILKMKAGGIQIIATYIFWIHHEEIEGVYDWTGQRHLRRFIELCEKCGVYAFLRLGPWNHGECRNGGFPDWLVEKDFEKRSDNDGYLAKVTEFYTEIFQQAQGLLFKDGGPVIGIQIENEYGHCGGFTGEKGMQHMRTLTRLAKEIGFEVPYYTATGWGGALIGDNLPVMGAYADAPWDFSVEQLPLNANYLIGDDRNDAGIGSDFVGDDDNSMNSRNYTFNPLDFPWATAELGGGIMVTKHRRPIITAKDTEAMVFTRIASGANLIGYYMYHGGTNPDGKLTTLQEKKPRDYCDLPIKSYDFQGVIGENGLPHKSYKYLKLQHMFLADFGEKLAPMSTFFPKFNAIDPADTENLRISVRHFENSGFVFLNNYQRHLDLPDRKDLEIVVDLRETQIKFPKITLKERENIALPFNLEINKTTIEYAIGQPLCMLNSDTIVFWNEEGNLELKVDGDVYHLSSMEEKIIGGLKIKVVDREFAENAWKLKKDGIDIFEFSAATVIENGEKYKQISENSAQVYPTFELIKTEENGDKFYKIDLSEPFQNDERDVFLNIDFTGNIANLYFDGELVADWFFTGLPWKLSLKKFKGKLQNVEVTLQIKPLRENEIYLEWEPEYTNGAICKLDKLSYVTEHEQEVNL